MWGEVGQDRKLSGRQLVQSSERSHAGGVAGEDFSELRLLLGICVERGTSLVLGEMVTL